MYYKKNSWKKWKCLLKNQNQQNHLNQQNNLNQQLMPNNNNNHKLLNHNNQLQKLYNKNNQNQKNHNLKLNKRRKLFKPKLIVKLLPWIVCLKKKLINYSHKNVKCKIKINWFMTPISRRINWKPTFMLGERMSMANMLNMLDQILKLKFLRN